MARSLLNPIKRLLTPTEVSMAKAPDKILDPVAHGGSLYPIAEPDSIKGVARIDLVGSGEISAAISLMRTVCPVLYMGCIDASTLVTSLYMYEWMHLALSRQQRTR
jgi:hypothetical protein